MAKKARESAQIEKARRKLKRHLEDAEKRFNADALAKMMLLNQKQLERHKPLRINLKSRQVTLFDENQHPAKTKSTFVKHLLDQLEKPKTTKQPLEGRITLPENEIR